MNGVRARVLSAVAGQLGNPHGPLGRGFAVLLNRANKRAIAAAVAAAAVRPGQCAADLGFGGGAGLSLLLARIGNSGTVHGVEISPDMLARARSAFAREITSGRLCLAEGSLTALPLADHSLDSAITVNTIYFVADLAAACAELVRVVRPGGRIVVDIGDPDAMAKLPFTPYGFRLRPVAEVIAALEQAGCTVDHQRSTTPPLPRHLLIATP
ncbi:methyltransferase domain-containing protein [Nocardia brasiliensis]|uniref:Methyltransferase domain-containing protein n=1 Tax=Nocardia brasiliensis TaxID=37326 RepID=A0A6G9XJC2_NOCBR|nr:methyltransferase domain-containing protein [Nocardia brasiliensis]QIS01015.1 methyltransferase domain-containing protein [Nocardia brasiliensis]